MEAVNQGSLGGQTSCAELPDRSRCDVSNHSFRYASRSHLAVLCRRAIYTLQPGGELLNRGQTEVKIAMPEASTWAMMLLGFAALGFAGYRTSRKSVLLAD